MEIERERKGKTNNPNGRKPGVANKVTTNIKAGIDAFLQSNWGSVQKEFNKLDSKDKLEFILKLMRYSVPTLQATAIQAEINTTNKIDSLTSEQLDRVIDSVLLESLGGKEDE